MDRVHLMPSVLYISGHLLSQPPLNVTRCFRWRGEQIKLFDFVFFRPHHSQCVVVKDYKVTDGFLTSASWKEGDSLIWRAFPSRWFSTYNIQRRFFFIAMLIRCILCYSHLMRGRWMDGWIGCVTLLCPAIAKIRPVFVHYNISLSYRTASVHINGFFLFCINHTYY